MLEVLSWILQPHVVSASALMLEEVTETNAVRDRVTRRAASPRADGRLVPDRSVSVTTTLLRYVHSKHEVNCTACNDTVIAASVDSSVSFWDTTMRDRTRKL